MDLVLGYVEVLAWPVVVLIGILVLGPGGILMKVADSIGSSVSDFTRSLPELNKTAVTMRADVDTLVNKSKEMSRGFSEEFAAIESRLDALSARIAASMSHVKAVVDEIDRSKIEEDRASIDQATEVVADAAVGPAVDAGLEIGVDEPDLSPDQMIAQIRATWTELAEAVRERAGGLSDFDGRQIGYMASRMADGRRNNPIPKKTAELIQALHSQFKRFTRMSASADEWLTVDLFNSFERGVQEALRSIRAD